VGLSNNLAVVFVGFGSDKHKYMKGVGVISMIQVMYSTRTRKMQPQMHLVEDT